MSSRFKRLSHVIWCCEYHIVWVPKYRFRILTGAVGEEIRKTIQVFCGRLDCEVVELNVQPDHVHLLVKVPPKQSISSLMGTLKVGCQKTASFSQNHCPGNGSIF
jgi:putative transposase